MKTINPIPQADPQLEVCRLNVLLGVGLTLIYAVLFVALLGWVIWQVPA